MNKKDLEHLSDLALIDIKEKEKILADLCSILDYVKELQKANTEDIKPSFGGLFEERINVFQEKQDNNDWFLEKEKGYLKGPKIL